MGWEIGKKPRVLPMSHSWHHNPLKISHDLIHGLRSLWSALRNKSRHIPRRHLSPHRAVAQSFMVICGPLRNFRAPVRKFIPVHFSPLLFISQPRCGPPTKATATADCARYSIALLSEPASTTSCAVRFVQFDIDPRRTKRQLQSAEPQPRDVSDGC